MTTTPDTLSAKPSRSRLWPLWGAAAGLLGWTATVILDTRPEGELLAADAGLPFTTDPSVMDQLTRMPNYLGFLFGFAAVAAMLVFQGAWKRWVEHRFPESIAGHVVSGGLIATAAGLTLAYGWKGALANYGYDGPETGLFGDEGLFVYYMLTDFGPYIPWLGVLVAAGALAWMAWRERLVSRVLGTISGLYFVGIFAGYAVTGVPGIAGPVGGLYLAAASLWLVLGRSRITLKELA